MDVFCLNLEISYFSRYDVSSLFIIHNFKVASSSKTLRSWKFKILFCSKHCYFIHSFLLSVFSFPFFFPYCFIFSPFRLFFPFFFPYCFIFSPFRLFFPFFFPYCFIFSPFRLFFPFFFPYCFIFSPFRLFFPFFFPYSFIFSPFLLLYPFFFPYCFIFSPFFLLSSVAGYRVPDLVQEGSMV